MMSRRAREKRRWSGDFFVSPRWKDALLRRFHRAFIGERERKRDAD